MTEEVKTFIDNLATFSDNANADEFKNNIKTKG